jgi:hypothetical protein
MLVGSVGSSTNTWITLRCPPGGAAFTNAIGKSMNTIRNPVRKTFISLILFSR